jgi:two-component sensor histidine kinase
MQIETMYHQEEHLKKIKDQELKIIQAERKIDSEKFKNIIYVSFSIFIALIFVLVLFIYLRSRRLSGMLLDQRNRISESLKEKEVLLKEIHHRVKNNLQVISSLLNLQRYSSGDKGVEYIIDETQNRINAIALVHQKLYQSENVGRIDFSVYIRELVEQESVIYLNKESPIEKIYEIEENSSFDIDLAVSLGLIVSELIINAFKYAFSADRKNVLIIKLSNKSKDEFTLVVRDSGAGLPPGFENGKKESLGMELVKILAEQINGSLSYRNDNGAVFTVQFKV